MNLKDYSTDELLLMAHDLTGELSDGQVRQVKLELYRRGVDDEAIAGIMDEKEEELEKTLSGEVWCITGSFENFNPRSEALKEIEKRGGRTVSSVTSKTTACPASSSLP